MSGGWGACEPEDTVRKRTCRAARLIADLGGHYAHHGQSHLLRQALTSLRDNLTNSRIQFYKPAFSGERKLATALCSPHLGPGGGWSAPTRPGPADRPPSTASIWERSGPHGPVPLRAMQVQGLTHFLLERRPVARPRPSSFQRKSADPSAASSFCYIKVSIKSSVVRFIL